MQWRERGFYPALSMVVTRNQSRFRILTIKAASAASLEFSWRSSQPVFHSPPRAFCLMARALEGKIDGYRDRDRSPTCFDLTPGLDGLRPPCYHLEPDFSQDRPLITLPTVLRPPGPERLVSGFVVRIDVAGLR